MNEQSRFPGEAAEAPVVIPVEAYVSEAYARAESEKLWSKVWQTTCRVEEIPKVGDYVTYDILDDSIIVVRTAPDRIEAFYNVCQHRGRRLTEGCGHTAQFYCRFHGWRWDLDGESVFVLDPEDWGSALNKDNLRLKSVRCDTWGGWVWINMDPDSQSLKDYLEPAYSMLAPFQMEAMRYRWRQWLHFPCNWKTALEAFNESYHATASHPQLSALGTTIYWSKGENHCGWHGVAAMRAGATQGGGTGVGSVLAGEGEDPRQAAADMHNEMLRTLNALTSETLVKVSNRLVDELPPEASADEVGAYLMETVIREDAARGVIWPTFDLAQIAAAGHDWHIFPNLVFLYGPVYALCYRARPNGYDPNSCIFEVFALERYPEGEAPKTEWVYEPDPTEEKWLLILSQDFGNMPKVQQGMKSRGFKGARPNPAQEAAVIHFHRLLAKYMGLGAPEPIT
jgi:nitrite reductase/ring-hydroxylating ferredoxin subunit